MMVPTTGWRRLIGSPKLQIIFHKRATKHRSLLRKMTYKDKGFYESSPPCTSESHDMVGGLILETANQNVGGLHQNALLRSS